MKEAISTVIAKTVYTDLLIQAWNKCAFNIDVDKYSSHHIRIIYCDLGHYYQSLYKNLMWNGLPGCMHAIGVEQGSRFALR